MEIMNILNSLTAGILVYLSIWDLIKKELPIGGLLTLSAFVIVQSGLFLRQGQGFLLLIRAMTMLMMASFCWWFAKKGHLGWGDLWLLSILALWLDPDLLCESLLSGVIHLAVCAVICQATVPWTKRKDQRIPVIPYVFLGILLSRTIG